MSRRRRRSRSRPSPTPDAPATIPMTPAPTTPPVEDDNPPGDTPEDDTPPSWELRLEARAFNEGWAIPPEARHLVLSRALDLVDDTTARGRKFDVDSKVRLRAMQVVLAAAKLDLDTRKLELDRARQEAPPATTPESVDAETVRIAAIRARRSALSLDAEPQPTEPDAQSTTE